MKNRLLIICLALSGTALNGCAVVGVLDAAVTVLSTAVSVGATVVGTAVDVAASGVRAVIPGKSDGK
jgi:hypothetical protein